MVRGFTGYMITTFMGDKNRSPIEEWSTVWSMAQILGKSCIHNNYFASFNGRCGLEVSLFHSFGELIDSIDQNFRVIDNTEFSPLLYHRTTNLRI